MNLAVQILRPDGIAFRGDCEKVVGYSDNGSFCLLPAHIDWVSSLKPGILTLTLIDRSERYFAVSQGILVKQDRAVMISTLHAVAGSLGKLQQAVERQQRAWDESEQEARLALDRLEATLVRQILEWKGAGHG